MGDTIFSPEELETARQNLSSMPTWDTVVITGGKSMSGRVVGSSSKILKFNQALRRDVQSIAFNHSRSLVFEIAKAFAGYESTCQADLSFRGDSQKSWWNRKRESRTLDSE